MLEGQAAVFRLRRECAPLGIGESRGHFLVEGGLVALDGQNVVGARVSQILHYGRLAAVSVDGDHGPFQDYTVKQAGDSRDLVAPGRARLLSQGQSLPHQEGAH